jgi:hypothetical protein
MKNYLYFAIIISIFSACSSSHKEQAESDMVSSATADTTVAKPANETFDLTHRSNLEKTGRKFIRTADVKCKVKNVREATNQIEDLTARYGGFITQSNLQTQTSYINTSAISADSTLETKAYTVTNEITLRVPNAQMDSLLRGLNQLVDFLDYRVIRAEDATLTLLASQQQQKRLQDYEKRATQTIDRQGRKLSETMNAEDDLLEKQRAMDEAQLQQQSLDDRVAYSTVQLQMYQRETFFREIIANPANVDEYRPNLVVRLWESLVDGWYILEEVIVFFARLWFLWALIITGVILYRRYGRKGKVPAMAVEK